MAPAPVTRHFPRPDTLAGELGGAAEGQQVMVDLKTAA